MKIKKMAIILASILMCCILAFTLIACSNNDSDDNGISGGNDNGISGGGDNGVTEPSIPDKAKDAPVYVGYRIDDKVVQASALTSLTFDKNAETSDVSYVDSSKIINASAYDVVAKLNEDIKVELLIKNPKRDMIVNVIINDSIDGKGKIYSTSSLKYPVVDITTERNNEDNIFYTYVTIVVKGVDYETQRDLEINSIEYLRDATNGFAEIGENQSIKNINVLYAVHAERATIASTIKHIGRGEFAKLSTKTYPDNAKFISYGLIYEKTEGFTVTENGEIKVNIFDRSIEMSIKVEVDNVVSQEIIIKNKCEIANVDDLNKIKIDVAGYYVVTRDLNFQGTNFKGIERLEGVLDGANYKMNDLSIGNVAEETSKEYQNGFVKLNNGVIKNFKFINPIIKAEVAGVVAGENNNAIINCFVENGYISTINLGVAYAGLITGVNRGVVKACSVVGRIVATSQKHGAVVGGIAGSNINTVKTEALIENCYAKVNVASAGRAGGIAGSIGNFGTILNSIVEVLNIVSESDSAYSIAAMSNVSLNKNILAISSKADSPPPMYSNPTLENIHIKERVDNTMDYNYYVDILKLDPTIWDLSDIALKLPKLKSNILY